LTETVVDI